MMADGTKQYVVGTVRPTNRPEAGREIELDNAIPAPITFLALTMNFTRGDEQEFRSSMPGYEAKVAELAAMRADLIRPSGAPPFMLLGFRGEQDMIQGWEKKYRVPMFTSGQNHVRALRALSVKKFIGASYFPDRLNAIFARYFTEAGFEVLAMEGIDVPFADVPRLPAEEIFARLKRLAEKYPEGEAIYMLGSAWNTLEIVDQLEQTLGRPVIHPSPARCWETQLRLGLRHPISGYGRLLAELPA
jgi:maleate cis-trans isomerase